MFLFPWVATITSRTYYLPGFPEKCLDINYVLLYVWDLCMSSDKAKFACWVRNIPFFPDISIWSSSSPWLKVPIPMEQFGSFYKVGWVSFSSTGALCQEEKSQMIVLVRHDNATSNCRKLTRKHYIPSLSIVLQILSFYYLGFLLILLLTKMADVPHWVDGGVLLIKYDQQRRCCDAASQCSAVQSLSWDK